MIHLNLSGDQLNITGKLLHEYRILHNLIQKDLVGELSHFSNAFEALNTVTLSRWETGATSTSLHKKKSLLNFLTAKGCLYQ